MRSGKASNGIRSSSLPRSSPLNPVTEVSKVSSHLLTSSTEVIHRSPFPNKLLRVVDPRLTPGLLYPTPLLRLLQPRISTNRNCSGTRLRARERGCARLCLLEDFQPGGSRTLLRRQATYCDPETKTLGCRTSTRSRVRGSQLPGNCSFFDQLLLYSEGNEVFLQAPADLGSPPGHRARLPERKCIQSARESSSDCQRIAGIQ